MIRTLWHASCGGCPRDPDPGGRAGLAGGGGDGHAAQAEATLKLDPYAGHLFVFRGRRGDLIKVIWYDGQGSCPFSKRLEKGRFVWPSAKEGRVALTPAQMAMLLDHPCRCPSVSC